MGRMCRRACIGACVCPMPRRRTWGQMAILCAMMGWTASFPPCRCPDTFGEDGLAVREVQSLVYRDAAGPDAPLGPPASSESSFDPASWAAHRRLVPSETLLFRFSALTFNSHRIHYDLPYAQAEERYRGLVVHGPLTATLLLDLARESFGDQAISTFSFRGLSPAMCGEPLHLVMGGPEDSIQLAAFADDGRQIMAAQATRA